MFSNKEKRYFLLFALAVLVACYVGIYHYAVSSPANVSPKEKRVQYAMLTGVKSEKLEYYKSLHAHPWPAVLKKITECHIENYSIFVQKIDDKYFLFSYFDYTGDNFDADMKKMADDSTTQRWWRETDPCQLPLPEAAAKKQIWTSMDEVFHNE